MEPRSKNGPSSPIKRIYKVVLTGGPCGGKTTGQSRLCTFFENLGWKVFRVPETATVLLSGGVKFAELSEEGALNFQENLLLTMLQMENTYFQLAERSHKNCLVICDRGSMDASAFINAEQWQQILTKNNLNTVDLRDNRYNQIIHMVSASVGAEDFYTVEDHCVRSENISLAQKLDGRAAAAWIGHPYFDVIDNSTDFEAKMKRLVMVVCQKIGLETGDRLRRNAKKLKYLVSGPLPPIENFSKFQDFTVEHIYLRTNSRKMQARIRKRGAEGHHSYTYTIRKPEKLGQIVEVRTAVTQRDWNTSKQQADDQHYPIYKTRRCFIHNAQYFQLDIYREPCHSRCLDLMLLETYSTNTGDEMKQRLPKFLNIVKEVTGQPEYSMYNLSLKDDWSTSGKFCVNIASNRLAVEELDRRRLSETDSDYCDGGDGRRVSECEGDWSYWESKMITNATSPEDEMKMKIAIDGDDELYEDMDKKYNFNRQMNGGKTEGEV